MTETTPRPGKLRTCQECGVQWTSVSWPGRGVHGRFRYCSYCRPARPKPPERQLVRCATCDISFETAHPLYRFCSSKCREHARSGTDRYKVCGRCGIKFEATAAHKLHCGRLACRLDFPPRPLFSRPAPVFRRPLVEAKRRCAWCCDPLRGISSQKYCSELCLRFALGHRRTAVDVFYPTCLVCEQLFVSRHSNALYCSKSCRRQARGQGVGAIRFRVFDRDDGVCQICGGITDASDFSERPGSDGRSSIIVGPLYPTVDHVVPRCFGGGDELSNLRTAHFRCNTERGVGVEGEQLAWAV